MLLYLAVSKLGEAPIDGITDTNPDGLTTAKGKWAEAFAARIAKGGLTCRLLDGDEYAKAMLEKHVWICAFMSTHDHTRHPAASNASHLETATPEMPIDPQLTLSRRFLSPSHISCSYDHTMHSDLPQ